VIDIDIDNDILTARISCYYNTRYRHAFAYAHSYVISV